MHNNSRDRHRVILGWLAASAMGGAILLSGCDQRPEAIYRVVRADSDQLAVTGENGELRRSFKLDTGTKVTVDGEPATVVQLEVGDEVSVSTKTIAGEEVATEIRAVSRERLDGNDEPPTLPADIPPGQALDTSLHGLDLPADTNTLSTPEGIDAPGSTQGRSTQGTGSVPPEDSVDDR